jgi:hypothetical protein
MTKSKADEDPLVSIPAAAAVIGVDRSTLSRQVALRKVRSHNGKVRVSEVIEDRRRTVDPGRRKPDQKPAASSQSFEDGVIALGAALIAQLGPTLAQAAIVCGAPMKVTAALHVEAGAQLWLLADRLASELIGREVEIDVPLSETLEPDWQALAAAAGEPYADEEWEQYKHERFAFPGARG